MQRRMRTRAGAAVTALAGLGLAAASATPATASGQVDDLALSQGFRKAVTVAGITEHLNAFQAIADEHGDRSSGNPGYAASKDYVISRLTAAGYTPQVQAFDFRFDYALSPSIFEQISPVAKTYTSADFATMSYSGSGDATGAVWAANTADTDQGCQSADFTGMPQGSIALVKRGNCPFAVKAENAENSGAAAVIVYNNTDGALNGTLGDTSDVDIPAIGTPTAIGIELLNGATSGATGVTVRVKTDRFSEIRTSWNVFAETAGGDPDNVILVGAHLDSVPKGPGINDNGTGSAGILEIAEVYAAQGRTPESKIRFAWWGAEEHGLVGSTRWVNTAPQSEIDRIALNLNFDMIGSPNYARFVYDGDNSAFPVGPGAAAGPAGSAYIEKVFHDYFTGVGIASGETPFSGRSDYGPFIAKGIPAGGLFTGAEGIKTAQQAELFGGTAGVAFDVCYHQPCDSIANVNMKGLDEMSDAAAHAVLTFSRWQFAKGALPTPTGPVSGDSTTVSGGGLHEDHHEDSE